MPNPDPLTALKHAQTIGPEPYDDRANWRISAMPLAPSSAIGGLLKAIPKAAPAMETLGEVDPAFTPTGGEGLFNTARTKIAQVVNPAYDDIVKKYLAKWTGGQ